MNTGICRLGLFICLAAILLQSCKDPEEIGLEVLPLKDKAGVSISDTISLTTSIVREDSLSTRSDFSAHLLGALNDPVFGKSKSSFYTQLNIISASPDFGLNPVCDSIVLSLFINGYYGDTLLTTHRFSIYKLDEILYKDSTRSTHRKPALASLLSVYETSDIHPKDSITANGVKAPQLLIRLDPSVGTDLLQNGIFASTSAFNANFKGLYIEDSLLSGNGAMLYFDLRDNLLSSYPSRLRIYYHNDADDSLHYDLAVNGSAHFNYFEHDYSSAVFASNFNDPVFGSNLCYIQSTAGIKTKIDFPFISTMIQQSNFAINKAVLKIYVDKTGNTDYPAHPRLGLTGIDSAGANYLLPDNLSSATSFGGDLVQGSFYSFNISRFVQQVLSGQRINYGLFLVANGGAVNAYRTVIGGSNHPDLKMKLELTVTKLN